MSYTRLYHWRLVQPRLVENRVYTYMAHPQTVEDKLDRRMLVYFRAASVFSTVMELSLQLMCVYSFHIASHIFRAVTGLSLSSERKMKMNTTPYREHHQPDTGKEGA